jgi:hypothetical protein
VENKVSALDEIPNTAGITDIPRHNLNLREDLFPKLVEPTAVTKGIVANHGPHSPTFDDHLFDKMATNESVSTSDRSRF